MVDKAKNEIAAIRLLELEGEAEGHLLCYFHFLQEWERFVRSAESGVSGMDAQHRVIASLAHLAHVKSEEMFEQKVSCSPGRPQPNNQPSCQCSPHDCTLVGCPFTLSAPAPLIRIAPASPPHLPCSSVPGTPTSCRTPKLW